MIGGPLLYIVGYQERDPRAASEDGTHGEGYSLAGYAVLCSLSSFYFFASAVSLWFIDDRRQSQEEGNAVTTKHGTAT